jgi:SAM-dependent methyltransferase
MPESIVQFFNVFESAEELPLVAAFVAILAATIRSARTRYPRSVAGQIAAPGGAIAPTWNLTDAVRTRVYRLLSFHDRLMAAIAGEHPERRLWHPQWLSVKDLYRDLHRILPTLRGRVLDVGCLGKPYSRWLSHVDAHVGADVKPGPAVDVLIRDGERWPLESGEFQSLLCTQVLQGVRTLPHLVREIDRVLEVGGMAVITTPFVYNDMTTQLERETYEDFWRHTILGVHELFAERFEIVELRRQGGFGSTSGTMFLNWVQFSLSRSTASRLLLAMLLPFWLLVCLLVNITGWVVDKLDKTDIFYGNVLLVVRKKAHNPGGDQAGERAHSSAL